MFIEFVFTLIVNRIKVALWLSFALIKGRMHGLSIIWDFISHFDNLFQILKMKLQKSLASLKVMSNGYKLKCVWKYFYLKCFFMKYFFLKILG